MEDGPMKDRKSKGAVAVWIGSGLAFFGLLFCVVFGVLYGSVAAPAGTSLREFLRTYLAPVLIALAFVVFGGATAAAGLVNRPRKGK